MIGGQWLNEDLHRLFVFAIALAQQNNIPNPVQALKGMYVRNHPFIFLYTIIVGVLPLLATLNESKQFSSTHSLQPFFSVPRLLCLFISFASDPRSHIALRCSVICSRTYEHYIIKLNVLRSVLIKKMYCIVLYFIVPQWFHITDRPARGLGRSSTTLIF